LGKGVVTFPNIFLKKEKKDMYKNEKKRYNEKGQ